MYAIGATQKAIAELATSEVSCFDSLESAVVAAKQTMVEGDVLLLSPGCASWDQFENYEQRGNLFCELVREVSPTQ
jgi:UDP-N-acetylmuramoylalanine--D-glutamate ligase